MPRLIDADALKKAWMNGDHSKRFIDFIDDAPTIDAEPVVRCKDCKYFMKYNGSPMCNRGLITVVKETDYCSCGTKMDEVQDD